MLTTEHELDLLEHIAKGAEPVHQRDLAREVGLSLGMTNAVLKRLAQKGWLTIRKINNRIIRYAVSPAGIEQITRRGFRYLKRTVRNIVEYRDAIESFVREVKNRGYSRLVLVGRSDLEFIVEHACGAWDLEYIRDDSRAESGDGLFMLYAESYLPDEEQKRLHPAAAYLRQVVPIAPPPRHARTKTASRVEGSPSKRRTARGGWLLPGRL